MVLVRKIYAIAMGTLLISCQTAELNRIQQENESLRGALTACQAEETQRKRNENELKERVQELEKEVRSLQDSRMELAKSKDELQKKAEALQKELQRSKEDNQHLVRLLEELRVHFNPNAKPSAAIPLTTESSGLERRSGLTKVKLPNGKQEYRDISQASPDGPAVFLSFEENQTGVPTLYLNVQHGYWVVRKGYQPTAVQFSRKGTLFPLHFTEADLLSTEQNGYRLEILRVPVKDKVREVLKELMREDGEVRLMVLFPDFSRERNLSRSELQAMGNLLYAFREMGGSL